MKTNSQLAKQLGKLLKSRELHLVTAESCTGGGLAYAITSIPGSSTWFDRGFITYSNESKRALLNVSQKTVDEKGAVSLETAQEMAEGALANSLADIAISITGIAGPDGGSREKPVGTICFALAQKQKLTQTFSKNFSGSRKKIREQAVQFILHWILTHLH